VAAATPVKKLAVHAYTIPTDQPESDGTLEWDSTTIVVVEAHAGEKTGLGYTYCDAAAAEVVSSQLAGVVEGEDAMDIRAAWLRMGAQLRNAGRPGIGFCAISAVDQALWDLKARLLDVPLVVLLGPAHDEVPIYGSGGFTSYPIERLQAQLGGWVAQGIPRVKMKIGTHPADDLDRVRAAREAIGPDALLYVDANGAYNRKQALDQAESFRECGVVWFEEPVSSDDLEGLHLIRDRGPAGMQIAAGEYGYDLWYFRRMLEAEAVDVLQADGSRCGGITGFVRAAALTESRSMRLSAHCAPTLHVSACCTIALLSPIEYFHDHARIEHMLFDGALSPVDGALHPDRSRPGLGIDFKRADAEHYAV
jgi:L-alanine-DL-glutamate epimerase-like enolase superfamily enzyme